MRVVLCHMSAMTLDSHYCTPQHSLFATHHQSTKVCGNTLQISGCVVHESGALLIEPGSAAGYDMMLRRVAPRTSPSGVCCVCASHIPWRVLL